MKTMAVLQTILRSVGGLVYPYACAACRQLLTDDRAEWCPSCTAQLLEATASSRCPRCAGRAEPYQIKPEGCPSCRGQATPLDGVACVGSYKGILGQLVRFYKYNRRQELDRPLGRLLAAVVTGAPWCGQIDALVPVPASLFERLRYRFWPVGLLAREVGRQLDLDRVPVLSVRGKKVRQVDLALSDRAANVRGVFRLRPGARVSGTRLCLIDDVMTSGATLREAARGLKKAGAVAVYAAVLVRAGKGEG